MKRYNIEKIHEEDYSFSIMATREKGVYVKYDDMEKFLADVVKQTGVSFRAMEIRYEEINKLLIEAYESIVERSKFDTLGKKYCIVCGDLWQNHRHKDCVVLKAKEYLEEHN